MKVFVPLTKIFLVPLATMASASAIDAAIQRKRVLQMQEKESP